MGKHKLRNFAELATFPNVVEMVYKGHGQDHPLKGQWNGAFFGANKPLVLELGCGKGEYTLGLARLYPEKHFVGVDVKGARLWRGAKTAIEENLRNTGFLRTQIEQLPCFFGPQEISEIWITFPDPQAQKTRASKRLTSPEYMEKYRPLLAKGGKLHLKTDNRFLFDYTLDVIRSKHGTVLDICYHVHKERASHPLFGIQTHYEQLFSAKGMSIHYLQWSL